MSGLPSATTAEQELLRDPSSKHLQDAAWVTDVFDRAAKANLESTLRKGSSVHLPAKGRLVMSGDLHDNSDNYRKLLKFADLARSPDHHLILHEVIHGEHHIGGRDFSIRTLARVAALKLAYPEQLHLLQANHELAQYLLENILKEGKSVVAAFDEGVEFLFGDQADEVRQAMGRFIRSLLMAVRCANGVFCSHSLPSHHKLAEFDTAIIDRVPTDDDLHFGSHVYQMVWGRRHTQEVLDKLTQAWGAKTFLMGHQPAEMGYVTVGDAILILASNHGHGMAAPLQLDRSYEVEDVVEDLVPLAAIQL